MSQTNDETRYLDVGESRRKIDIKILEDLMCWSFAYHIKVCDVYWQSHEDMNVMRLYLDLGRLFCGFDGWLA